MQTLTKDIPQHRYSRTTIRLRLTLNGTYHGSSTASLIYLTSMATGPTMIGGQGLQNASTSGNISLLFRSQTPGLISGFQYRRCPAIFNFDGKMDVITASGSSTFSVWENQSTRGNFVYYANFSSYVSTSLNSWYHFWHGR